MTLDSSPKPQLLLFVAAADHPHRDPACATLAWVAAELGMQFECYYAGLASGTHYGGGHPGQRGPADLRGGTFTGGHHLEQLYLAAQRFECKAACLGTSLLDGALAECKIPVTARSGDVVTFYTDLFARLTVPWPSTLLVVGDGGRPDGVSLRPYAFPEIFHRRAIAISDGDQAAVNALGEGMGTEELWTTRPAGTVGSITKSIAQRWRSDCSGILLGDPELVGRWTPTAIREGWLPVFGVPQAGVISEMSEELSRHDVVYGRQQDDRDFLELSRAGTSFQLIDPGRPAFPILKAGGHPPIPMNPTTRAAEPTDADLRRWAGEGRVLTSVLFWTGMVRELENLYALADAIGISGAAVGWVLTTASFEYMPRPPLTLVGVPRDQGGLAPQVEVLLGSGGAGAFLESEVRPERFREVLLRSVDRLADLLGGRSAVPVGWWGVMDAPLAHRRASRIEPTPDPPFMRIRYERRTQAFADLPPGPIRARRSIRTVVRKSPLGAFFEPRRPFDNFEPGPPGKGVLEAVRDAGFDYAFTKAAFAQEPTVVSGVPGLTAINYTVGRWDGWTPFATINSIRDLQRAERALLRTRRPGWLAGTLDTCLWAFTGPLWARGRDLKAICDWLARGGSSGRLVNVTPRVIARYAEILRATGQVGELAAR